MNMQLKLTLACAAACFLTPFSQPVSAAASAGSGEDKVTRTVRLSDLDLSSETGRETLQRRLRTAARQVCREAVPMIPGQYIQNGMCRDALMQEALIRIAGRNGRPAGRYVATLEKDTLSLVADTRAP